MKMKKFCNKINNKQWRMTVPNINNSIFRRTPRSTEEAVKRNSGHYDVQEAEREFERQHNLSNDVIILEKKSENTSEHQSTISEFRYECGAMQPESDDGQLYMDVELAKKHEDLCGDENVEYDVPRISFKFIEKQEDTTEKCDNTYENIVGESSQEENLQSVVDQNYEIVSVKQYVPKPRVKSEMKIVLTAVEIDIGEDSLAPEQAPSSAEPSGRSRSRSVSHEYVASTYVELKDNQHDSDVKMRKCGSVPNVNITNVEEPEVENFYMVPRSLKQKRHSQSLKDFKLEDADDLTSNCYSNTSIEHISCSQLIIPSNQSCLSEPVITNYNESDYTKARGRFPRLTLLKKPQSKWNHWKSKLNSKLMEQAAHQRVGAFDDRPKVSINVEEVIKNSKSKCKSMLNKTGKIFQRKKNSSEPSTPDTAAQNSSVSTKTELKACDIEYKLNLSDRSASRNSDKDVSEPDDSLDLIKTPSDFGTIRSTFGKIKSTASYEGQNGFEDLRRYVKQGSDFCKELSTILQDRAEAEATYAKSLQKLSCKLSRACREGVGTLNEGWKAVAQELESRAESHRLLGAALLEESAKPLRTMTDNQQKNRKQAENAVDKAAKALSEWRAVEAKSKKNSHACARENEKLQDAAVIDHSRLSRSTSLIHLGNLQKSTTDKENAKLEGKKRKAEDAVRKADIEYYTLCVRAERARLEWESAVFRGVDSFQSLEEERLNNLKTALSAYLHHSSEHGPRLIEATERLRNPASQSESTKDLTTFVNLRQTSHQISEQLLPDFYCEHITLAMNRERRKQALIKLLHLIRQDIERERKSKIGLENLSKAIKQTPNFGAEDSQQSVTEKLFHMKSMLTYLEAARYKVQNALAELDSRPRTGHPLAPHITITRDKSGLQQSVLKVPQWLREEWNDCEKSPVSEKSMNSEKSDLHGNEIEDPPDWTDRGAADGNSNQPDSDFDEFSSQCSSTGEIKHSLEDHEVQPIAQCKALYPYTPNLNDELALNPGDILSVYRQQDDGWWLGECNGNVGIFPATYVEILPA